uniref:Uncharacterized protein n=1 Tax=Sphaerodactylus townsendi TaxID=933632 RepID=A0ACB8EDU0_9SAUR
MEGLLLSRVGGEEGEAIHCFKTYLRPAEETTPPTSDKQPGLSGTQDFCSEHRKRASWLKTPRKKKEEHQGGEEKLLDRLSSPEWCWVVPGPGGGNELGVQFPAAVRRPICAALSIPVFRK